MGPDESFAEFIDARGADLSRTALLLAGEQVAAEFLLRDALVKSMRQWEKLRAGGDPDNFVRQSMLTSTWFWWWHLPPRRGRFATSVLPDRALIPSEAEPRAKPARGGEVSPFAPHAAVAFQPAKSPPPEITAENADRGSAAVLGDSVPGDPVPGTPVPENPLLENAVLAAVLPRLTSRQRVVLYLHFGEGVSNAEAAQRLHTSPGTVARHLRSALTKLREFAPGLLVVPPSATRTEWEAYRRLAGSVRSFADVDEVRSGAGRQRRVGALVAAIPLAAIALVAASTLNPMGEARTPEAQTDSAAERSASQGLGTENGTEYGPPGSTVDPDEWRQLDDGPLPPGTLLASVDDGTCEFRPCRTYLLAADGERFDLGDLLPNLAYDESVTLIGATWSPDGNWLGFPRDGTYEFHDLSTGEMTMIPSPPSGTFYQAVGWSDHSRTALLVRIEDGLVAGYVVFNTRLGTTDSVPQPAGPRQWPVGVGRRGEFLVTEPDAAKASIAAEATPVGKAKLDAIGVHADFADEQVMVDVTSELRPGETIYGPGTVPEIARPVGHEYEEALGWVTVYRPAVLGREPSAVVFVGRYGQTTRFDLPHSNGGASYRLLGPMDGGVGLLVRTPMQMTEAELVHLTALGRRTVQSFPANADVVLPGMPG